jgi:hypothetical protein
MYVCNDKVGAAFEFSAARRTPHSVVSTVAGGGAYGDVGDGVDTQVFLSLCLCLSLCL